MKRGHASLTGSGTAIKHILLKNTFHLFAKEQVLEKHFVEDLVDF